MDAQCALLPSYTHAHTNTHIHTLLRCPSIRCHPPTHRYPPTAARPLQIFRAEAATSLRGPYNMASVSANVTSLAGHYQVLAMGEYCWCWWW